jgi:hypothetical protein
VDPEDVDSLEEKSLASHVLMVVAKRNDYYATLPLAAYPVQNDTCTQDLIVTICYMVLVQSFKLQETRAQTFGMDGTSDFVKWENIGFGRVGIPDAWTNCKVIVSCSKTFMEGVMVVRHANGRWYCTYNTVDLNHMMKAIAWALRSPARIIMLGNLPVFMSPWLEDELPSWLLIGPLRDNCDNLHPIFQ